MRWLIVVAVLIILQQSDAEFYTSVHQLSKLFKYEHYFLHNIQKFIADNENKLAYLKARLTEFEQERDEAVQEGAAYFDSPVNKFLLTKRLTMDWERIENLLEQHAGEKYLRKIEQYKSKHVLPDHSELEGAIGGLLRLQDIYRLRTKDIATGILNGVQYNTELAARHCFDIGKLALQENKYKLSYSWLLEAVRRLESQAENVVGYGLVEEPLRKLDILRMLIDVKQKLGILASTKKSSGVVLTLAPNTTNLEDDQELKDQLNNLTASMLVEPFDEHDAIPADLLSSDQSTRYKYTCNGHIRKTPAEERDLRCGYLTETHPFLLIAPLKVEELNHDPLLVIYHEVISESEIAVVKELSNQHFQRARVLGVDGPVVSPVRTSQFAFLPKTTHPVLQVIDQRVADMTNLNMDYSEEHQFANYGIGGHYSEHHDWFHDEFMNKAAEAPTAYERSNRIATVLFYLSDVEQGGGTAFPYLKQLLLPKKGSAAFWHNLHASGVGDMRTLHGACPIIVGSKWVQNRWIRDCFQDERRPCELYDDRVLHFS